MSTDHPPKALLFDVFGTVVEWRSCVSRALHDAAQHAVNDQRDISAQTREAASAMTLQDWTGLTEVWRESYKRFTSTYNPSESDRFITIDEYHYTELTHLLASRNIAGLFTDAEKWQLTHAWHRLNPWADSVEGLTRLNTSFRTATLSNGNVALLEDLCAYARLPFADVLSAEHFGAYKPAPAVYLAAARKLGLEPGECALVAAHLGDLAAAKGVGFQTVYVPREGEEIPEREGDREKQEVVDMWVGKGEGLLGVAGRFDCR